MRKIYFFASIVIVIICGCHTENGPCEYNFTEIQAKVESIEPYKDFPGPAQLFHIQVRFNESGLAGRTQFLEDWVPRIKGKTDAEFIRRNNININDIYTGIVSEIKNESKTRMENFISKNNCEKVYVSFNYYFKTE